MKRESISLRNEKENKTKQNKTKQKNPALSEVINKAQTEVINVYVFECNWTNPHNSGPRDHQTKMCKAS